MKLVRNGTFYFTLLIVLLSILTPEVECRRLVLRGRRTITRHYYRGTAIPAWAIIVVCGVANLLIGVVLYFILRKVILSTPVGNSNSYEPVAEMDKFA